MRSSYTHGSSSISATGAVQVVPIPKVFKDSDLPCLLRLDVSKGWSDSLWETLQQHGWRKAGGKKKLFYRKGWDRGTRPTQRDVQKDEHGHRVTNFSYVLNSSFQEEKDIVQFIRTLQHSLRAAHTEELELQGGYNKQMWSDLIELGWK